MPRGSTSSHKAHEETQRKKAASDFARPRGQLRPFVPFCVFRGEESAPKFFSGHPSDRSPRPSKPWPKVYRFNTRVRFCYTKKDRRTRVPSMRLGTRVRLRRVKTAQSTSFCGRWADLANFCSSRRFRSRAVVPRRVSGPLVCSGPRLFQPVAPKGRLKRHLSYMHAACQNTVVGH
jgi:hypothetical protein